MSVSCTRPWRRRSVPLYTLPTASRAAAHSPSSARRIVSCARAHTPGSVESARRTPRRARAAQASSRQAVSGANLRALVEAAHHIDG